MNKRPLFEASGRRFLERISEWLSGFGVETQAIARRDEVVELRGLRRCACA